MFSFSTEKLPSHASGAYKAWNLIITIGHKRRVLRWSRGGYGSLRKWWYMKVIYYKKVALHLCIGKSCLTYVKQH